MVDIGTLHEHDFLLHLFVGNSMTAVGIRFVAVHTLKLDGLTIIEIVATYQTEFVLTCGDVLNLNLSETNISGVGVDSTAFLVFQFAHEDITLRALSRPRTHGLTYRNLRGGQHLAAFLHQRNGNSSLHAADRLSGITVKFHLEQLISQLELLILFAEIGNIGLHVEHCIRVVGILIRGNGHYIAHLHLWLRREINIAVDARQAEHVLTFEERTVAVAVHFQRHNVLALLVEVGSDVELR